MCASAGKSKSERERETESEREKDRETCNTAHLISYCCNVFAFVFRNT